MPAMLVERHLDVIERKLMLLLEDLQDLRALAEEQATELDADRAVSAASPTEAAPPATPPGAVAA